MNKFNNTGRSAISALDADQPNQQTDRLQSPKKRNLLIRENATPILMALFSAGLAGCSVGPTTTSGTALKGRLENAEVFIDTDGDGTWTSGVDSDKVRTDSDGNYSIADSSELTGDIIVTTDETNMGTDAALEFEQSAHQVMTIINTLAEAESSTSWVLK